VDKEKRQQLQYRFPPPKILRSDQLIESIKDGHTDDNVPPALEVILRPSVQPYLISMFLQYPAKAFGKMHFPARSI
ncbi:alpha/beta hydrolase, partial [Pseudomonas sp. CCI4.2]|nr:alpha/beta hydrolase [Pseudomonas sp. CCI4.2]